MRQYECTNTFTSQKGEYYARGAKIYENEYYNLSSTDKSNFKQVTSDLEEFDTPIPGVDTDTEDWNVKGDFEDEGDEMLDDLVQDDGDGGDYGQAEEDFNDFGDGDTGGAGASDDF